MGKLRAATMQLQSNIVERSFATALVKLLINKVDSLHSGSLCLYVLLCGRGILSVEGNNRGYLSISFCKWCFKGQTDTYKRYRQCLYALCHGFKGYAYIRAYKSQNALSCPKAVWQEPRDVPKALYVGFALDFISKFFASYGLPLNE